MGDVSYHRAFGRINWPLWRENTIHVEGFHEPAFFILGLVAGTRPLRIRPRRLARDCRSALARFDVFDPDRGELGRRPGKADQQQGAVPAGRADRPGSGPAGEAAPARWRPSSCAGSRPRERRDGGCLTASRRRRRWRWARGSAWPGADGGSPPGAAPACWRTARDGRPSARKAATSRPLAGSGDSPCPAHQSHQAGIAAR